MSDELLVFEGVRWPRVRITEESPLITKFVDDRGGETRPSYAYSFAPEGTGRRYKVRGPAGWWRDFVDMMKSNDRQAVLAFLARRGDPAGLLELASLNATKQRLGQPPGADPKPSTREWSGLHTTLGNLASAWTPPDREGVSRIDPALWNDADVVWREITSPWWLSEIELVPDPERKQPFILRPKSLATFMAISGASAFYRKSKMRRCTHCASWFVFARAHAEFCSTSCRTLAHADRGA